MRKLLLVLIVVAGAVLAVQHFTGGSLTLGLGQSAEAKEIKRLSSELASVARDYDTAGKGAAISGVDTSSEATAALNSLDRIERELVQVEKRIKPADAAARAAAVELHRRIKDLRASML
ncbi:MAG: hypothetical protein GXP47_09865 [Acidobacteria bacterium]|nr:hypothetical protein [Acidobacteriota bacterium]